MVLLHRRYSLLQDWRDQLMMVRMPSMDRVASMLMVLVLACDILRALPQVLPPW